MRSAAEILKSPRYGGAPISWIDITRMLREEPPMSIEILDPILPLAVNGLIEFFDNRRSGRLGLPVM